MRPSFLMTWKSYSVVSSATVLAGWLASSSPSNMPAGSAPAERAAPAAPSAADSDIEQQAMRLQAQVRRETAYREPDRNPFQFGSRRTAGSFASSAPSAPSP